MLGIYSQPQFEAPLPEIQGAGYRQGAEHIQDPNIISTLPMQRPVIPSLEEAAEAEDTSTRPRLTQEQIAVLEDNFKSKPKPGTEFKKQLASQIGLSLQRVNVSRVPSLSLPCTDILSLELVSEPPSQGEAPETSRTKI